MLFRKPEPGSLPQNEEWTMQRVSRVLMVASLLVGITACEGSGVKMSVGESAGSAEAPVANDPAAVRAAIDAANSKAMEGANAGSADAMLANYADDAVAMMPGMKAMVGKAAIDAGMKGMFQSMDVKNFKATTTDVMVEGNVAVETGTLTYEGGPKGGKLVADTTKYITVWKKQADGSWKIVRDINNTDIAPKM
jgi:uncharacterized protein (TIGR02246 family)